MGFGFVTVSFLLLLYICFEVNYFIRFFFYLVLLRTKKTSASLHEIACTLGICTTNDLDFMLHMNNARYLREMDFNRIWFYGSSGLIKEARRLKGTVVQTGCSIRYRKPITFLQLFKVECKVLYWDERNMYLEQKIITLHDGFIRAIALTKQTVVGTTMLNIVRSVGGNELHSPFPTPELVKWMESNEISSQNLRRQDPTFEKERPTYPYTAADRVFGMQNSLPCACRQEATCGCPEKSGKID